MVELQIGNSTGGSLSGAVGTKISGNGGIQSGNATGGSVAGAYGTEITGSGAMAFITTATGSSAFGVYSAVGSSRYVVLIKNEVGSGKSLSSSAETTDTKVPFVNWNLTESPSAADGWAITEYPFKATNLPSTPSATAGTELNAGATTNNYTSWSTLFSGASVTSNVQWLLIKVHTSATATVSDLITLDIGVDTAGGTSFTTVIGDLMISNAPSLTQAGSVEFLIPIFVASGDSIGVRAYVGATAINPRVIATVFGGSDFAPSGTTFATLGVTSHDGTAFTPGNNTWGSWVELGTTGSDYWYWQLAYRIANTAITAEYTYIELAWGDAGTKNAIYTYAHGGTTGESVGTRFSTNMMSQACFAEVPSGSKIYVRGWTNNAPDTGYTAMALGVGGTVPHVVEGGGGIIMPARSRVFSPMGSY